jgi:hypothetical protein
MFGLTFFYYIVLSVVLWTTIVNANTEIRNFEVTEQREIVIPQTSKWQERPCQFEIQQKRTDISNSQADPFSRKK